MKRKTTTTNRVKSKQALNKNKKVQPGNGKPTLRKSKSFTIVGIGASAGGLEAFSTLMANLPPNLGMAYVFIQHLSPNHESYLPQIISRKTPMPVHQAADKMQIKKNNVYIIPRGWDSLFRGWYMVDGGW